MIFITKIIVLSIIGVASVISLAALGDIAFNYTQRKNQNKKSSHCSGSYSSESSSKEAFRTGSCQDLDMDDVDSSSMVTL